MTYKPEFPYTHTNKRKFLSTKVQLISELEKLRRKVEELETADTKYKQVEEALWKSEQKLSRIYDSAGVVLFYLAVEPDDCFRFLSINRLFLDSTGLAKDQIVGKRIEEVIPEPSVWMVRDNYKKAIREKRIVRWEETSEYPTGVKVGEVSVTPFFDNIGVCTHLVGIVHDITERKRAEDELRREKEFTETALDAQLDTFFLFDPVTGKALRWNKTFRDISGYTDDEIASLPAPVSYYSTDDLKRAVPFVEKVMKDGSGTIELDFIGKDGRKIPTEYLVSTIYDEDGNPKQLISIGRDITERKQAEEEKDNLQAQVNQAQRMEAIGTLAGGVAHDFNNLLVGILGRTSLMLNEIDPSHPFYSHLKQIEDCVGSASELTGNLLGFARGGKYQVESTDLNDLLKKTSEMFNRTKKEIKIYTKFQDDVWPVEVDRSQIEQALLNLYVNAWQAMPEGGYLYLETENMILGNNKMRHFTGNPGRYVKISVTDTGVGIDKQIQKKIFELFFTARERGKGIGLGLSSAYGIIKNHGGVINVYSEKGQGTTFNIYLPATEKEVLKMEGVANEIKEGTESVLVVDDEDIPRDVAKEILEKLGYAVLVAKSGKEAIEICSSKSVEIDMVILDMIMPEMDGGETFDKLKDIDPEVRVLLSSGCTVNGQAQDILNRGCKGFLQKPYNMTSLSQKMREILDKK